MSSVATGTTRPFALTWNVTAGSTGHAIADASTMTMPTTNSGSATSTTRHELRAEIEERAAPQCGRGAEQQRERDQQRQRDGHEQGRVAQRLRDRGADAHLVDRRLAEIEVCDPLEPVDVAQRRGAVEAERLAQLLDRIRGGVAPERRGREVARQQLRRRGRSGPTPPAIGGAGRDPSQDQPQHVAPPGGGRGCDRSRVAREPRPSRPGVRKAMRP